MVMHPTRGLLNVVAFTDLDGTANNEELPESERLSSIGPAKEVVAALQRAGISTGINSGRSYGEALVYARELECKGPIICEDGTVLVLPTQFDPSAVVLPRTLRDRLVQHEDRWVVLMTSCGIDTFRTIVDKANKELQRSNPEHPAMVGSFELQSIIAERKETTRERLLAASPAAERIQQALKYAGSNELLAATHRLATCFIVNDNYETFEQTGPLDTQRRLLREIAESYGVDMVSPRLPHLRGKGVDKSTAVELLAKYSREFLGVNSRGMLPICFGNNDNDVRMMQRIANFDGLGVLAAHPDPEKGHYVDTAEVRSPNVFVASKPYGHGMQEGLAFVREHLKARYSVDVAI